MSWVCLSRHWRQSFRSSSLILEIKVVTFARFYLSELIVDRSCIWNADIWHSRVFSSFKFPYFRPLLTIILVGGIKGHLIQTCRDQINLHICLLLGDLTYTTAWSGRSLGVDGLAREVHRHVHLVISLNRLVQHRTHLQRVRNITKFCSSQLTSHRCLMNVIWVYLVSKGLFLDFFSLFGNQLRVLLYSGPQFSIFRPELDNLWALFLVGKLDPIQLELS